MVVRALGRHAAAQLAKTGVDEQIAKMEVSVVRLAKMKTPSLRILQG